MAKGPVDEQKTTVPAHASEVVIRHEAINRRGTFLIVVEPLRLVKLFVTSFRFGNKHEVKEADLNTFQKQHDVEALHSVTLVVRSDDDDPVVIKTSLVPA